MSDISSSTWPKLSASVVCFALSMSYNAVVQANPISQPPKTATDKLRQAVRAELVGDRVAREQLLKEAVALDPSSAATNSQIGLLRDRSEWMSIDRSVEKYRSDNKIQEYDQRRTAASDTVADHWAMAIWCEQNELPEQRRSHLNRILRLEPEHVAARTALGYRRLGMNWVSQEQINANIERVNLVRKSFAKFGRPVQSIVRAMENTKTELDQRAVDRLAKLNGPLAIPAVEVGFSNTRDNVTEQGLSWLHKQPEQSAGLALGRFALFHNSADVRYSAGLKLSERDLYEYAPEIIQLVNCPVTTGLVPFFNNDGVIQGYRHLLYREGAEQNDVMMIDTAFVARGTVNNPLDYLLTSIDVMNRAQQSAAAREELVSQENARTNQLNARVASLLSLVSGSTIAADAREIRDWWYKTNETEASRLRSFRYARLYNEVPYDVSVAPRLSLGPSECFVRGTPVMTRQGLMPIEQIRLGDLVLSKNVRSGILAWKAVLEPTQREPAELVQIKVGNETFRCTRGHVFWVSGKGWRKASTLQAGDVLHGAEQPAIVDLIVDAGQEETFNLIVADNANYFVGEQLILSHDFTPRAHSPELVPGVVQVE